MHSHPDDIHVVFTWLLKVLLWFVDHHLMNPLLSNNQGSCNRPTWCFNQRSSSHVVVAYWSYHIIEPQPGRMLAAAVMVRTIHSWSPQQPPTRCASA
jgi:hypothetical protein